MNPRQRRNAGSLRGQLVSNALVSIVLPLSLAGAVAFFILNYHLQIIESSFARSQRRAYPGHRGDRHPGPGEQRRAPARRVSHRANHRGEGVGHRPRRRRCGARRPRAAPRGRSGGDADRGDRGAVPKPQEPRDRARRQHVPPPADRRLALLRRSLLHGSQRVQRGPHQPDERLRPVRRDVVAERVGPIPVRRRHRVRRLRRRVVRRDLGAHRGPRHRRAARGHEVGARDRTGAAHRRPDRADHFRGTRSGGHGERRPHRRNELRARPRAHHELAKST